MAGLDIVMLGFVRVVTRGLYHFRRRAYHIQHRCQPPSRAYWFHTISFGFSNCTVSFFKNSFEMGVSILFDLLWRPFLLLILRKSRGGYFGLPWMSPDNSTVTTHLFNLCDNRFFAWERRALKPGKIIWLRGGRDLSREFIFGELGSKNSLLI